jgi:hypothetical protein
MVTSRPPTRVIVRRNRAAFVLLNHYRCDLGDLRTPTSVQIRLAGVTSTESASVKLTLANSRLRYCGKGDPGSVLTVSPFEPTIFRAVCTGKASLVALPPYACARKPVRLPVRARSTASRLCLTLASGSGHLERCAAQAWQRRRREHAHVCQQLRCSPTSTPAENANQRTPVAMANNPSVALPAKGDTGVGLRCKEGSEDV